MITSLQMKNFKAWKALPAVELAPLTGLFGANSAGKSSLVQLLLLLKQTAESADRTQVLHLGDRRSAVDLGSYRDIVFGHEAARPIEWEVKWRVQAPFEVPSAQEGEPPALSTDQLGHYARVHVNGQGRVFVEQFGYNVNGRRVCMERDTGGQYVLRSEPVHLRRRRGRPPELPPPVKCYGFPDKVKAVYQNAEFLSDLELAFEEQFARVYYLGPLREYPQREYAWGGGEPSDVGPRGERVIEALLAARQRGPTIPSGRRRRSLEEHVAHWLRQLKLVASFRVEELAPGSNLYRVWVQRGPRSPEVLLTDVGFGVSQVLPVITLLFYVPSGSTVLLEHPEIHLHPSVQAGLADVLIDAVKAHGIQVIVESHSEHLLRRLQRRVAEGAWSEKDTALYFCQSGKNGATIEQLQLNLYGEIANWPDEFFGDELGEMLATQRAALVRKQRAA